MISNDSWDNEVIIDNDDTYTNINTINTINNNDISVSTSNLLKLEIFESSLPKEISKDKKMSLLIVVLLQMIFNGNSEKLEKIYTLLNKKNILVTFHPVTLENETAEYQITELLNALSELEETRLIFTMSNADTGGEKINNLIKNYVSKNPNAIHLLEKHRNEIKCIPFSINPGIFEPDINQINKNILEQATILDPILN